MSIKLVKKITVLVFVNILLVGCSSKAGLITSLEDLTTEAKKEGWSKVPQYRVISVPGILPFANVGSLQFYKPKRKPSSVIGLSNTDNSYVMESIIESECNETCLLTIKNNLLLLKGKAETLVEAKINLTRVVEISPPEGADATKITSYNQAVTNARTQFSTAKNELNISYNTVVQSINKNGILIYRWNSNSGNNGALKLGDIFGVSGNKSETYSGFALISGLRTATLYLGKDIASNGTALNKESNYSNRFELTTYVMQAKHIIYTTEYDLQSMMNAKLEASYAQLKNLPETIKNLDKIEINIALSKVTNLSNMGILGKVKRTAKNVLWDQPAGITTLTDLNGWQTFYSVESDLNDLIDMLKESQ